MIAIILFVFLFSDHDVITGSLSSPPFSSVIFSKFITITFFLSPSSSCSSLKFTYFFYYQSLSVFNTSVRLGKPHAIWGQSKDIIPSWSKVSSWHHSPVTNLWRKSDNKRGKPAPALKLTALINFPTFLASGLYGIFSTYRQCCLTIDRLTLVTSLDYFISKFIVNIATYRHKITSKNIHMISCGKKSQCCSQFWNVSFIKTDGATVSSDISKYAKVIGIKTHKMCCT